jgi:hypothetical protein
LKKKKKKKKKKKEEEEEDTESLPFIAAIFSCYRNWDWRVPPCAIRCHVFRYR